MKLAVVHQLSLEDYPPARNALDFLSRQEGFELAAWSSADHIGLPKYAPLSHSVRRPAYPAIEDTFIREAAEWAAARPNTMTLHICGHNIKADVWAWLEIEHLTPRSGNYPQ